MWTLHGVVGQSQIWWTTINGVVWGLVRNFDQAGELTSSYLARSYFMGGELYYYDNKKILVEQEMLTFAYTHPEEFLMSELL